MMLLDSNIIVYTAEPGYDALKKFILSLENRKKLETVFQSLPILPLADEIIDRAILLRQKKKMSLGDALIAATALTYQLAITTANVKDYTWIDDLEVVNAVSC